MPLLTVKGLKTHFQTQEGTVRAVDGVDFTLGEGESLGLAGESGCGKTTAALSIMRLLPSNGKIVDGTIDYVGYDLAKVTEGQLRAIRWKHISIIFQGAMNALNPVKRIGDQIAEPIVIHDKVDKEVAMKRVGELLELVGIHRERAQEYPHEFSGGMRQRVMIAMALACNPRIVIADEPVTGGARDRPGRLQEREASVHEGPDRRLPGHRGSADAPGVHPGPLAFVDQPAPRVPLPSPVQVRLAAVHRPGTRSRPGRSGPLRRMPPEHHDPAAEGGDVRWPASRISS